MVKVEIAILIFKSQSETAAKVKLSVFNQKFVLYLSCLACLCALCLVLGKELQHREVKWTRTVNGSTEVKWTRRVNAVFLHAVFDLYYYLFFY
jgi:hypothetical protein